MVRDVATPLVFDHFWRVFLWGSLRGRDLGLAFDPELLNVGAMFHDLGLTKSLRRTDQRFEIDGGDEARAFLHAHGITGEPADRVWTAIALHRRHRGHRFRIAGPVQRGRERRGVRRHPGHQPDR
jgi:HD superfamily phosphodiesterase